MQALLDRFFSQLKGAAFRVVYWDGTKRTYGEGETAFTLTIRNRAVAGRMLRNPEMAFPEAYVDGDVEVDGDLDAVFRLAYTNRAAVGRTLIRFLRAVLNWLPKTAAQNRRHVHHHYDLGNDFFRLWLDASMTYSCAYFRSPSDSLHQAQLQKVDHVLRKLNLKPGERLLDIGCGWGWLITRAAQQFGVQAVGITLSEEQYKAVQERIQEYNVAGKAEVRLQDYYQLAAGGDRFDKVASVGMFEQVGRAHIGGFMRSLARVLKPGGLCLLHTITRRLEEPVDAWTRKYIFPGGYIPSWREVIAAMADFDLRLLDTEDLRPHYARTLDAWTANFEKVRERVQEMYDERFVRMWRIYLRGSAAAFRYGTIHLHQFLVSHGLASDYPMTRDYLYQPR